MPSKTFSLDRDCRIDTLNQIFVLPRLCLSSTAKWLFRIMHDQQLIQQRPNLGLITVKICTYILIYKHTVVDSKDVNSAHFCIKLRVT